METRNYLAQATRTLSIELGGWHDKEQRENQTIYTHTHNMTGEQTTVRSTGDKS